jgi:adenosine deaminase
VTPSLEEYVKGLPKAELHVHIEGTLEPELAFELARKHGIALPYPSVEALRRAYDFSDLQSFLDIYFAGANVLRDAEDFHALAAAYLRRAHADGVVHAEIFFDPQTHTARGVPIGSVIEGLSRALAEARRETGMSASLILCFLRHLPAEDAQRTLESALPYAGSFVGVGLDSTELGHPPAKFTDVFAQARRENLRTVAHAGEEGPAAYIEEALDRLRVERIDHGVRCEESPGLVDRLVRERIPLTVCPLSNVKLRVFPTLEQHNLKRLLDRGVCVTVNSDDPAYFGGYIVENFLGVARGLDLGAADLTRLAQHSIDGSFLDAAAKQHWNAAIRAYSAATVIA